MTGLLLFGVLLLWAWVSWVTTKALCRKLPHSRWRYFVGAISFAGLLALPLADELVGGWQFRSLCERNAVLTIDPARVKGKTVRLVINPSNQEVPGTALQILHSHYSFQDVAAQAEIASYDRYVVKGGWFIRTLGISENNAPLTIGRSACSPDDRGQLDKKYDFTLIN